MRRPFASATATAFSRLQSRNEYAENERLQQQFDGSNPRKAFINALCVYTAAEGSSRQVKLIEPVIRTSRKVVNDDGVMQREDRRTLVAIYSRYRKFGSTDMPPPLHTYREARIMIKDLFF
jgi:hypothetical protein